MNGPKINGRFFFFAQRLDSATQLRQFSQEICTLQTGADASDDFSYGDWEQIFRALGDFAKEERLVVVIDEDSYLAEMVAGGR